MQRKNLARRRSVPRSLGFSILAALAIGSLGCQTCSHRGPDVRLDPTTTETPRVDVPARQIGPVSLAGSQSESAQPAALSAEELNDEIHRQGLLGDVYFDLDRFELSEETRSSLERNARYLAGSPSVRLLIEGHCDERGTNEYNLALGQLRAAAARQYLVRLGVAGDRLGTITYGEERGVCYDSRESCWTRNRRAYFRIAGT